MSVLGYRDLNSSQRVGGFYAKLEDVEAAADYMSFDVYISDDCPGGGRHKWFMVAASTVDRSPSTEESDSSAEGTR